MSLKCRPLFKVWNIAALTAEFDMKFVDNVPNCVAMLSPDMTWSLASHVFTMEPRYDIVFHGFQDYPLGPILLIWYNFNSSMDK